MVLSHGGSPNQAGKIKGGSDGRCNEDTPETDSGETGDVLSTAQTGHLDLSSHSSAQLLQAANRAQLQELYFSEFHPHWPLLHKDTFQSTPQPPGLVQVVLLIGLWMVNTDEARTQAASYHDTLLRDLESHLVDHLMAPAVAAEQGRLD
jgi:hypothetical protein